MRFHCICKSKMDVSCWSQRCIIKITTETASVNQFATTTAMTLAFKTRDTAQQQMQFGSSPSSKILKNICNDLDKMHLLSSVNYKMQFRERLICFRKAGHFKCLCPFLTWFMYRSQTLTSPVENFPKVPSDYLCVFTE